MLSRPDSVKIDVADMVSRVIFGFTMATLLVFD